MYGSGFRAGGIWFRVQGLECRVKALGYGFRVQGVGFAAMEGAMACRCREKRSRSESL